MRLLAAASYRNYFGPSEAVNLGGSQSVLYLGVGPAA